MFQVDYSQVQQQAEQWRLDRQHPKDPVREVVELGALFMLGRAVGRRIKDRRDQQQWPAR